MTKALVTGSTGFLGSTLVAGLNERKIDVIGLRRKNSPEDAIEGLKLTFVVGDILDAESLVEAMKGVDWVFHVAAVADYWRTPEAVIYKVNVDGSGLERITFNETFDGFPMFSPDGKRLVFASNRNAKTQGDTNVFIADWVD